MSKQKVIITCAVTGNAPVNPKHPNFPVTPRQIADAVDEAAKAGAAIAHIHVRDPETGAGSRDVALFKEVVSRIRDRGTNIAINLTAGMGALFLPDPEDESRALPGSDVIGVEARIAHLADCLPDIASLDVTTGNQEEGGFEFVYLNTTRTLRGMAKRFKQLGVKPELEAFQAGDVLFANQLVAEGLVDGPPMYQFVLGVKWGAPANPETVTYMKNLIEPKNAIWTAMGIARAQFPTAAQSILLGGHVRVGLEDNLYLDRGVFATNGQLVERAVRLIEAVGGAAATTAEAREILHLRKA
ncbi:MAG: 3-keto-5-aminohexanoate cleavage protein [Hyphomonas sp.]|uniref:3-keto-5-aminohexanoate cleavage protein n=1 Tax=Hyphomonas sp. TaxID=87 RepID=UPI0017CDF04B|nr:3-keto-5-aminohexanoate cleavage protein [Hyphomonas sp.]MBA3069259.1 3-keto-5-aminohexanoate cleavage protein [Hyphomonas sp.]MBU3919045.1 3-keto-5-aminohexanoate cleavage protein [Alphaproteobacteria bacterium]MBU4061794.1 3-keto-5-aminohexanoate cleavage protein [Alphaproteobacteria bacterium]MBU4163374.1 3-keto-5-aminohexanoate cleavage protein [Alphaproteobacteria bacterium]